MFWILFLLLIASVHGLKFDDKLNLNVRNGACAISGSDCSACGYGYLPCGLDSCYNPGIGETCCSGNYGCISTIHCSISTEACVQSITVNTTASRTLTLISVTQAITITSTMTSTMTQTVTLHSSRPTQSNHTQTVGSANGTTSNGTSTLSMQSSVNPTTVVNATSTLLACSSTIASNSTNMVSINNTASATAIGITPLPGGNYSATTQLPSSTTTSANGSTHNRASRDRQYRLVGFMAAILVVILQV